MACECLAQIGSMRLGAIHPDIHIATFFGKAFAVNIVEKLRPTSTTVALCSSFATTPSSAGTGGHEVDDLSRSAGGTRRSMERVLRLSTMNFSERRASRVFHGAINAGRPSAWPITKARFRCGGNAIWRSWRRLESLCVWAAGGSRDGYFV